MVVFVVVVVVVVVVVLLLLLLILLPRLLFLYRTLAACSDWCARAEWISLAKRRTSCPRTR